MVKINQVAEFKSCLTCAVRKPCAPGMSTGQPVFSRFFCGLGPETGKETVKPQEVCDFWKGVTLETD